MVENADLYRPRDTSPRPRTDVAIYTRDGKSWSATIKNTVCATVHGNSNIFQRAEDHFCGWVTSAEKIWVQSKEQELQRLLCVDGRLCRMFIKMTLDFAFPENEKKSLGQMCHSGFDTLRHDCPDGGGVAEAQVVTPSGETHGGRIEASFNHDTQEPCHPSDSKQCLTFSDL